MGLNPFDCAAAPGDHTMGATYESSAASSLLNGESSPSPARAWDASGAGAGAPP